MTSIDKNFITDMVRDNIYLLDNSLETNFPERFSNEIFLSYGASLKQYNPLEYQSNFSIKFVMSGEEEYFIDGNRKSICKNKMLIVNDKSNCIFKYADANALSIFIEPRVLSDCKVALCKRGNFLNDPFNNESQPLYFYDSIQDINQDLSRYFNHIINNKNLILTIDFFYELSEKLLISQNKLQKEIDKILVKKESTKREIYKRLRLGKSYIDDNLKESFDLETISHLSCLSKYHFIRLFKELYGVTPHRYYTFKRMNNIYELLGNVNNQYSLNEIVFDYGFTNYSIFYKQFRSIFKCAPSEAIKRKVNG